MAESSGEGSQGPVEQISYTSEMGVDHRDFFRLLPRAMGTTPYEVEGTRVNARIGQGTLEIVIGPEQIRAIALFRLPYCEVSFTFRNVSVAEQQAFKTYFDLRFQRGGG